MATTYKLISSVTVGTATNTISFTSIPQTYTDLVIKASLRGSTTTTTFAVQVNGTTITSVIRLFGGGNFTSADTFNEHYINPSDFTANVFGSTDLYFPNYTTSINSTIASIIILFDSKYHQLLYYYYYYYCLHHYHHHYHHYHYYYYSYI
jgi:hypothetical protein